MKIILAQRIDFQSNYDDVPFVTYHYPKRYRHQIRSGDRFIYYQGDRYKKDNRYYFGCGVIGAIETGATDESYYAEILEGYRFPKNVSIYSNLGDGFIESLGYDQVRKKPNPSWQSSIRKISDTAFSEILNLASISPNIGDSVSLLETEADALNVLKLLNERYSNMEPKQRTKQIQNLIDRGSSISRSLKKILGAKCQVCGWEGFEKGNGDKFIEAHHITQLSEKVEGSLCTENIVLLCANCHREVHYGKTFTVVDRGEYIDIALSKCRASIRKNTIENLSRINL